MAGDERPIGVFDSGIGGLTVFKALADRLPGERMVYLGDTARVPYGTKSAEVVARYSLKNAQFLLEREIKLLVVACNTASAVAVPRLAANLPIPVVGVIEPGAKAAAARGKSRVGVIGTPGTIRSGAYQRALLAHRPELSVFTQACPLFVPLAEEGWTRGAVPAAIAREYLASLRAQEIDALVLGCTHYPLLREVIAEEMGPNVALIDSAQATSEAVAEALDARGLRGNGSGGHAFFVTDTVERFIEVGQRFLGQPIDSAEQVDLPFS
jgi:glutamate racemase